VSRVLDPGRFIAVHVNATLLTSEPLSGAALFFRRGVCTCPTKFLFWDDVLRVGLDYDCRHVVSCSVKLVLIMSSGSGLSEHRRGDAVTISFGERFAHSEQFDAVFKEGMALVERTASYLDGDGRRDAKTLKAPLTVIYATESMRLTTRLLELASWLLVRRGLKEGELTAEEATKKRSRIKLRPFGRPNHIANFEELPSGLRDLIEASFALNDRIMQIDKSLETPVAPMTANPVASQMAQLTQAFVRQARH
jgi:regulator of CtrA degradation